MAHGKGVQNHRPLNNRHHAWKNTCTIGRRYHCAAANNNSIIPYFDTERLQKNQQQDINCASLG
eukprot:4300953-Ditylum_brightwellii.AAC.1